MPHCRKSGSIAQCCQSIRPVILSSSETNILLGWRSGCLSVGRVRVLLLSGMRYGTVRRYLSKFCMCSYGDCFW